MIHYFQYLITWCLASNVAVGLVIVYISQQISSGVLHDKITTFSVLCIAIHSFHVLLVDLFFPDQRFLDWAAPYGLAYGPLLYLSMKTLVQEYRPRKRDYLIHASPFFLFFVLYVLSLCMVHHQEWLKSFIWNTIFKALIISYFGYGLTCLYLYTRSELKWKPSLGLFIKVGLMLILIGLLFMSNKSAPPGLKVSRLPGRLMIYCVMLFVIIAVLRNKISLFKRSFSRPSQLLEVPDDTAKTSKSYEKSALNESMMDIYESRLKTLVESEKLYLDPSLSMDLLAGKTRIPKHHLSQLFSARIGRSFVDYINQQRVQYACERLAKGIDVSFEQLGYDSGFNSKVSFYRNFKLHTRLTPSQYMSHLNSNS